MVQEIVLNQSLSAIPIAFAACLLEILEDSLRVDRRALPTGIVKSASEVAVGHRTYGLKPPRVY